MKKIITLAAMAAAVLAGCTKQEAPAAVETDTREAQYITMNAGFANTDTKLAFEADGTGYKTTWTTSDIVRLYYNNYKTGGSGALFTGEGDVLPDQTDQTKAQIEFKVTGISELAKAANVKWGAYVSNGHETAKETYGFWTDSYGTQDGTEAGAQKLIFYYAGGTNLLSDLKSPVSFSCKNTMLKFTLTFPSGVTTGTASGITISGTNIYTTANYSWGGLYSGNKGDITISDQTITDGKITFYATVAPSKVSGVKVTANVGDETYTAVVEEGEKTLSAGTVYNISRNFTQAKEVTIYKPHTACEYTFDSGLTTASGWPSWAAYNAGTGIVSLDADAASTYTKTDLKFTSGDKITVYRISVEDFLGNSAYTLHSYAFKTTGYSTTTEVSKSGRDYYTTGISIIEKTGGEINGHTVNAAVTGLFLDLELPVSIDIQEDGIKVYTYFTNTSYMTASNEKKYAFIPELTNSTSYSTGYYAPLKFGTDDCNYFWLGWNVDLTDGLKVVVGTTDDRKVSSDRWCYGISIVEQGYSEGAYTTIYQLNWKNSVDWTGTSGTYFGKDEK